MHFIGQKITVYGHETYENGSLYSKLSRFCYCGSGEVFEFGHTAINQQTKTVDILALHNFLAHMYKMCGVYCQLHKFVA